MPLIINVGTILLLAILDLLLRAGKGAFLIAGYNTATEEEKEKTDEKKLCKAVGNLLLSIACILAGLYTIFDNKVLLILEFSSVIGAVIYAIASSVMISKRENK